MKKYDVVIIGSGMGGLVCATILGKEGYSVCLLEKNRQLGGSLQTYVRDRVIFDSGVHYIGGLSPGQNLYQIFKYLGMMDKLRLVPMEQDVFDMVVIEGNPEEYPMAQGYENFIRQLTKKFPGDEAPIRKYCERIREICSRFPLYNLATEGGLEEKMGVLEIDTKTFIESITENKLLQDVLSGNNALYAGQADKTPLYVHALVLNSYIQGSWKCLDGGSQISKVLTSIIREQGGDIFRNTRVTEICETDGRISSVKTENGKSYSADNFISNIHPVKTLELTDSDVLRKAYRHRINNLENSVSSFTLNLVFKKNTFKYFLHNYYCHEPGTVWTGANYTEESWPEGYAIFLAPSSRSPVYAEGMTILAYMRYDDVKKWENTFNTVGHESKRGDDYDEFKINRAERLLDKVERKFPGLRDCIKTYYTATPLSYRDYIGTNDGSLYGIVKDYRNALKTFIAPTTRIPNLYFTGQNLNLHGILGVSMSSLVTCTALLGNNNLVTKIRNA